MPNLKDALSRLLTIPGVRATVLVGRDGLPIESAGRGNGRFHEDVGAMGASALGTTEALGQALGAGRTVAVLLEYEDVLVSVDPLSEFVTPGDTGRERRQPWPDSPYAPCQPS